VKAVVLVGGEGTRLRPLTYETPKPLLPIANQPFLERQLAWMESHGIDHVVLALGYLPDAFVAQFPEGSFGKVRLQYVVEGEPLGTAGAIRYAAEMAGIDERFVVCNGDVLTALDLGGLVRFHDERGGEATIHLVRVTDPSAFGVVPTHPDGEVKAFVEKPPPGTAPTDWVNAGTYVLEPSVLARIPARMNVSVEREIFPRMLDRRGGLFGCQSDVYWIDIGTPDKYLAAHHDVLTGALGLPPVAGAEQAAPGVWLQRGAVVSESARIDAPVLVGPDSVVGAGAALVSVSLGAGCSIEEGARLTRSVLLDGASVGRDAVVTDCVLGADVRVGDGVVLRDETRISEEAARAGGER
jgi:mannose-1-phosphate guanylyltransferase